MLKPIAALGRRLEARFRLLTFAGALMPTVAALGVQLVAFAITARGLGLEPFGAYTALLAVSLVSIELVGLGGADLLVRGVAHDPSRFPVYFGNLLILAGLTLLPVLAAGTWVAVHFVETPVDLAGVLMVLAGEVIVGRAASSLELIMVAHRHTVRAGWIRLLTASLRLALAAAFFLVLGLHALDSWIAAVFVQSLVTTAAYVALAARLYGRPKAALLLDEVRAGAAFCLNQASRSSQGSFDRMVLSRFSTDASVGIYGAASRVFLIGLFPIQVVTRVTYPNFFLHGKEGGLRASRRYALKIAPVLFAVGLAASGAAALLGQFAPFLLGRDFAGVAGVAAALSLALPLIALQYPPADALTGAGRQGVRAALSVCMTLGFGFNMAAGAAYAGIDGLVVAFLTSHALFALSMWAAAFLCKDAQ